MPFQRELFGTVRGSDVDRDGMYLEVDRLTDTRSVLLEIFYSDVTDEMTVDVFENGLALELYEWASAEARRRLIPVR